jgi:hypothetical protein
MHTYNLNMYLSIYIYTRINTYVYIHMYTYICIHMYTYICIHTYVYTHMYTYIYRYMCVCVYFFGNGKIRFWDVCPIKKMMFHVRVKFTKGYATSPEKK